MDTLKYKISFTNRVYFHNKQFLGLLIKSYNKDTFNFSFKVPYNHILDDMKHDRKKSDSTNFLTDLRLQYSTFFGNAELPIAESGKIKIPEPPEIQIKDIKIKSGLGSENIQAEVRIRVANNSKYNLKVNRMDYSINILKVAEVKGFYSNSLNIKGNSVSELNIPVKIHLRKEKESLVSLLRDNELHHYVLRVDGVINSSDFEQERPTKIKLIKEDDIVLMQ